MRSLEHSKVISPDVHDFESAARQLLEEPAKERWQAIRKQLVSSHHTPRAPANRVRQHNCAAPNTRPQPRGADLTG